MSDRNFWFNRCTFKRRDVVGMDPVSHTPAFAETLVLQDEPCDLFNKPRRVAQQGPNGLVYNTVEEPTLKIFPDSFASLPDEDDVVVVDGVTYRILSRVDSVDAGSGRYMGSRLVLHRVVGVAVQTAPPSDVLHFPAPGLFPRPGLLPVGG
jgi:hypothetical protein